ncbi:hypothetical protein DFH06DRAFT_1465460 [Mycena polygramma]|nr:hypothetical protein DFH06DRAFT_1465460 [Mycena polygramma]
MDSGSHTEHESNSTLTNFESASCGGAMFCGSQNFSVTGGTFTNITKHYTSVPNLPSDFRMIPLGDIDLQHEIRQNGRSSVVHRRQERAKLRKVYSAKIDGRTSEMALAVYQGDGAEEEWREDIAKYMSVRHPNILQIRGAASSGGIHATLFHDDLIPYRDFLDQYRHLPISTVYISGSSATGFMNADSYFHRVFRQSLYEHECTFWIARSTGRLCVDLVCSHWSTGHPFRLGRLEVINSGGQDLLTTINQTATVIDSLTLEQYHRICYIQLSRTRVLHLSTPRTVNLGALMFGPSNDLNHVDSLMEVAVVSEIRVVLCQWYLAGVEGNIMQDGWTRFNSDAVEDLISLEIGSRHHGYWLNQANFIFERLHISSDFEKYRLVNDVIFHITFTSIAEETATGYLFLCPTENFQTAPLSFQWPDCPFYWSLDPSGTERLSMEEAAHLGFPTAHLSMQIEASSWDTGVYAGLRQFHRAKGFDPETQDVAQHLGQPLYRLSSEVDAAFSHGDKKKSPVEDGSHNCLLESDELGDTRDACNDNDGDHPTDREETSLSQTCKIFVNVQLALISFLILSWLYEQVLFAPGS